MEKLDPTCDGSMRSVQNTNGFTQDEAMFGHRERGRKELKETLLEAHNTITF